MTKTEIVRLVTAARELWPAQWNVTETTYEVWLHLLADVDFAAAMDALLILSITGEFYPRPGPGDVLLKVQAIATPDDETAWRQARRYLSRSYPDLGRYAPDASDQSREARAYRAAGGYPAVNDGKYGRAAFMKALAAIDAADRDQAAVTHITTITSTAIEGNRRGQLTAD